MLATSALMLGTAVVGVVGGTSTYALWNDEVPIAATSISTGGSSLQISGTLSPVTNMLPGETASQAVLVTNTGSAGLDVTPTLTTTYSDFQLRILMIGQGDDCASYDLSGYDTVGTTPDTNTNPAQQVQVAAIGPGAVRQACVMITALPTITPTESVTFQLQLDGVQDDSAIG